MVALNEFPYYVLDWRPGVRDSRAGRHSHSICSGLWRSIRQCQRPGYALALQLAAQAYPNRRGLTIGTVTASQAQNEAKTRKLFLNYRIRVAEVVRDYGPT